MAPPDTSLSPTSAQPPNQHLNDSQTPTFTTTLHSKSTNLTMPSPQQRQNVARPYESLKPHLADQQAKVCVAQAQAPLPPGSRTFPYTGPPLRSSFYARPASGATRTPSLSPPIDPQKPVAIINGYLGTSTTYPEAWPLSWLALTNYPRMAVRCQPYTNDNIKAHLRAHLTTPFTASFANSSERGALAQHQTSQVHPSLPPPTKESSEDRPKMKDERPKASVGKEHLLHPERHRCNLYAEMDLQTTRSAEFVNDSPGYVQATSASLPSLSTEAEPKDQIIDLLAQIAHPSKVARAQMVSDTPAANEEIDKIDARGAARATVESQKTERENDDKEDGAAREEDLRQRMIGLNAILATEVNRARSNHIIDQFAGQEEQQKHEILCREAVQESLTMYEAEQERYPGEISTSDTSGQQEKLRRDANKERLPLEAGEGRLHRQVKEHLLSSQLAPSSDSGQWEQLSREADEDRMHNEAEAEWVIVGADEERLPSATANSGSLSQQKKKEKN